MSQYISRQLNAIDEIKSKIETVVQSVSSGGWDLSQGRMSGGRAAADLLDDWNVRFHGTLPDEVMLILGGLMTAVRDWRSNMGQTATPADLIEGPGNSVNELLKAVRALEAKLNSELQGSQRSLVERHVARLKNHPFVAVLIVLGLSVIAIAQFTGAVQELLSLLPSREQQLPDLVIYKVDSKNSKVHIANRGKKAVSTDKLYLAWSQGPYEKPEWNNSIKVGYAKYIDHRQIEPGESLPVTIESLSDADEDTEFMIDAGEMIEESDESNNCVNTAAEIVPCRRSLSRELRETLMEGDDPG